MPGANGKGPTVHPHGVIGPWLIMVGAAQKAPEKKWPRQQPRPFFVAI
jgi:hypothetical protein